MSITFSNDELCKKFINRLKEIGVTDYGCAACLGNVYSESHFRVDNAEDKFMTKYGITDAQYVSSVDAGTWKTPDTAKDFIKDGIGFGWAQWTYWSRKQGLYNLAKSYKASIADADVQFDWYIQEIKARKVLYADLKDSTKSIDALARKVMLDFEKPSNVSESAQLKRVEYAEECYAHFFTSTPEVVIPKSTYSRTAFVAQMSKWLGAKKGDAKHKDIVDTYNSRLPHPRGYKLSYNDAWCAATVCAAGIKLGYMDILPFECSCGKLITQAKAMGIWQENDAYVPSPGDWILFDWDDTGIGDDTVGHNHVGCVENVIGNVITTIEGNYSNQCQRRKLNVNGRYIRGYITPKYSEVQETVPAPSEIPYVEYTVVKGDTLKKIASAFKLDSYWDIVNANPIIKDPNKISIGWVLKIPQNMLLEQTPTIVYVTKDLNCLARIAAASGVPLATVKKLNPQYPAPFHIVKIGQPVRVK